MEVTLGRNRVLKALARSPIGAFAFRHETSEEVVVLAVTLNAVWMILSGLLGAGIASAAIATSTATYHPSYPLSPKAVAFIERHEGVRYYAYNDPSGIAACTDGAGHVEDWRMCTYAQMHTAVSAAQVAAWLRSDTNTARSCITREVTRPINQAQYEALVDLVFNAGCGSLYYRNVIGLVNAGALSSLASAWESTATTAGGIYLAGLAQRRIDEVTLYLRNYYGAGIGYLVKAKPLTKAQLAEKKLRARTGYYAWLAWYLHEKPWRQYAVHALIVRPHVPQTIPALWWRRERTFVRARG